MDNSFHEKKEELTPQQQNAQLKNIFLSYVPLKEDFFSSGEEKDDSYPEFPSPYAKKFSEKIRSIISTAPITDSFKDYIVEGAEIHAQVGWPSERKKEDLLEHPNLFFLDSKYPESGGIFDKKRASQLERRAIGEQITRMLPSERSKGSFKKMGEELGDEEFAQRVISGLEEATAQTAERWRRQFKENYGEDI